MYVQLIIPIWLNLRRKWGKVSLSITPIINFSFLYWDIFCNTSVKEWLWSNVHHLPAIVWCKKESKYDETQSDFTYDSCFEFTSGNKMDTRDLYMCFTLYRSKRKLNLKFFLCVIQYSFTPYQFLFRQINNLWPVNSFLSFININSLFDFKNSTMR